MHRTPRRHTVGLRMLKRSAIAALATRRVEKTLEKKRPHHLTCWRSAGWTCAICAGGVLLLLVLLVLASSWVGGGAAHGWHVDWLSRDDSGERAPTKVSVGVISQVQT